MTTHTFSTNFSVSTDAYYRAWVQALITALTTAGLVQTSDTGQINTTTVNVPAAQSTVGGYAIFRFDDTAQSTYPLFIKLEFGTAVSPGTVANACPGVWLTVGKSSSGTGDIGSVLFPRRALHGSFNNAGATGTTIAYSGVASGGTDWVSLFPWLGMIAGVNIGNAGYRAPWFHIERTNGGQGVVVATRVPSSTSNSVEQLISTNGNIAMPDVMQINYATATYVEGTPPVVIPYSINGTALGPSTSIAAGSIAPIFPWVVTVPGLAPAQLVNIMTYPGGDAPASAFASTLNAVSRNYFPIPLSDAHNAFGFSRTPSDAGSSGTSRYIGAAIRWD